MIDYMMSSMRHELYENVIKVFRKWNMVLRLF